MGASSSSEVPVHQSASDDTDATAASTDVTTIVNTAELEGNYYIIIISIYINDIISRFLSSLYIHDRK